MTPKEFKTKMKAVQSYVDRYMVPTIQSAVKESDQALTAFVWGAFYGEEKRAEVDAMGGVSWPEQSMFALGLYSGPIARAYILNAIKEEIMPILIKGLKEEVVPLIIDALKSALSG